jgi:nickel/cobalt exporter
MSGAKLSSCHAQRCRRANSGRAVRAKGVVMRHSLSGPGRWRRRAALGPDKAVAHGSAILALCVIMAGLVLPTHGLAHPLGNFSISHYTAIHIAREVIELRYIIDMAEIPTFQELQETKVVPQEGHPNLPAYASRRAEALREGLILEVNGRRLPLQSGASEVLFPSGAGGLPTLKLGAVYRAQLDAGAAAGVNELRYRDTNFPGRAGWKEVVATGVDGISLLSSSVPERDRSRQLVDYPTDFLNSPPQDLEAQVVFAWRAASPSAAALDPWPVFPRPPGGGNGDRASSPSLLGGDDTDGGRIASAAPVQARLAPMRLLVNRQGAPRSSFAEFVTAQHLSVGMIVFAAAVAAGLGAFHALEPGHGKTVVAAYLVGSRGTAWHALTLGLIVTATHTAGVYLLGAVTLFASRYVVPERLYPWLGVLSGLIIFALGLSLFLRRYAGSGPHGHHHGHAHAHGHSHHGHAHHHAHDRPHAHPQATHVHPTAVATVSLRELLALGVTGGIVPCPAALVVLLSALSLGRARFGFLLIVAFSVGLAAVLIAIGILMVSAQRLMSRFHGEGILITRWLPLTSAAAITAFGVVIAVQSLVSAGILVIR